MRLFIAIQLSDEMKKALIICMHDLKKQGVEGNYVPAENLHLTLAFIGEYKEPERVKKVMDFGNLLWVGVKGNQKLKTYVKELRAALKEEGIPFDDDKFVPHITIVRKASAKKPYQVHLPKAEMTVKKVSLMKSEMRKGRVVYREV